MDPKRTKLLGSVIAASTLVLALGAAPMIGFGADHLDAPNLTAPSMRPDADINDVYAFQGRNEKRTVIAVTTHPAAGAIAPLEYATDVKYTIKIDRNGDAQADVQYTAVFGEPKMNGRQPYKVVWRSGNRQRPVAHGTTGSVSDVRGGGKVFAGLRSDPFFFDLAAFQGSVLGTGTRAFCDGDEVDFFAELNTNAIVLQVPDKALGRNIGVWAVTTTDEGDRIDRMGRPAINTVFNSGDDKNRYNQGQPATDYQRFSDNVRGVLKTFSALDDEGAYTNAQTRGRRRPVERPRAHRRRDRRRAEHRDRRVRLRRPRRHRGDRKRLRRSPRRLPREVPVPREAARVAVHDRSAPGAPRPRSHRPIRGDSDPPRPPEPAGSIERHEEMGDGTHEAARGRRARGFGRDRRLHLPDAGSGTPAPRRA
jgi:hypothetical protein